MATLDTRRRTGVLTGLTLGACLAWVAVPAGGQQLEAMSGVSAVCPEPPADALVVDVPGEPRLYSSRGQSESFFGPVSVEVPAGTYDVWLTSFDDHVTEERVKPSQPREQYFLEGSQDGTVVWESSAISDLPDDRNHLTERVDRGVSIPQLDGLVFRHAAYPDDSSANSHEPVCVFLVPVAQTTTTETSTTTTTAPPGALGDRVWLDADGDGIQDPSEPGLGGVDVSLLDSAGSVIGSTVTSENGEYRFDGLAPGTYRLRFGLPDLADRENERWTAFQQGDDPGVDSDANPDGTSPPIDLQPGEVDLTWDAGVLGEQVSGTQVTTTTDVATTEAPTTTSTAPSTTSTTVPPVTQSTLPFTGLGAGGAGAAGLVAAAGGVLLLAALGSSSRSRGRQPVVGEWRPLPPRRRRRTHR